MTNPTSPTSPASPAPLPTPRIEVVQPSYRINVQEMTIMWTLVGGIVPNQTGYTQTTQDAVSALEGRDDGVWGDQGCIAAVEQDIAARGFSNVPVMLAQPEQRILPPTTPQAVTGAEPEQTPP